MVNCQYIISVENHGAIICKIIQELVEATSQKGSVNSLRHQFKLYQGDFSGSAYADPNQMGEFKLSSAVSFDSFKGQ